jgi:hypothetical protein
VTGLPAADADLLASLRGMPAELRGLVQGRPVERLRQPASDGGWGAIEHLAHLRDWEEVFLGRVVAVVERERPELPAYDDSLWSIERQYQSRDVPRTLDEFEGLRGEVVAVVERLPAAGWEREGIHGQAGPVTLRWLLHRLDDHGRDHLAQVRELLA